MDARKELFKVLKSSDFITGFDNKKIQIKDVKEGVTTIELPHLESIDFSKQTLLVEPSDQSFMLFLITVIRVRSYILIKRKKMPHGLLNYPIRK